MLHRNIETKSNVQIICPVQFLPQLGQKGWLDCRPCQSTATEEDELEWYKTHEGHWALRKVLLAKEPKDPARGERIKEENLSDTVKEIIKKD